MVGLNFFLKYNSGFVAVVLAAIFACISNVQGYSSLVQDPGCETTLSASWVASSGSWTCSVGSGSARNGLGAFSAPTSATSVLYQDIFVGDFPNIATWTVRLYLASHNYNPTYSGWIYLSLQQMDVNKNFLGSSWSSGYNSLTTTYLEYLDYEGAPLNPSTAYLRVYLITSSSSFSTSNPGQADDVYISLVPYNNGTNLLINGGCEQSGGWVGDFSCDSLFPPSWYDYQTLFYPPIEGNNHLRHGNASVSNKIINQTVNLAAYASNIDTHTITVVFEGYYRLCDSIYHDSTLTVSLLSFSASGAVLANTIVAYLPPADFSQWQYMQATLSSQTVPVGTRSILISLNTSIGQYAVPEWAWSTPQANVQGPYQFFNFNFYGTVFNFYCISSNGIVLFTNSATTCPSAPNSAIGTIPTSSPTYWVGWFTELQGANFYQGSDLITFWLSGFAPNRVLYVVWDGIPGVFSGGLVGQLQIYEISGLVQMHTYSWSGSNSQLCSQGATGSTTGVAVSGRNYAKFSVTNDGIQINPQSNTYSVVTYNFVNFANPGNDQYGFAYYDGMSLFATTHSQSVCDGDASIVTLSGSDTGVIMDSFSLYGSSWSCNWVITSLSVGQILMTFTEVNMASSSDGVQVYSDTGFTTAVGSLVTGTTSGVTRLSAGSGTMSVRFTSSSSTTGIGFTGSYQLIPYPVVTSVSPSGGVAGISVTIVGTNFSTVSVNIGVLFGSTACAVTSASFNTIICTTQTPSANGVFNVIVSNLGVSSLSPYQTFTYTTAPTLSSIYPVGGVNRIVTLFGTNFGTVTTAYTTASIQNSSGTYVSCPSISNYFGISGSLQTFNCTLPACPNCGLRNIFISDYGAASNVFQYNYILTPNISSISPASGAPGSSVTIVGSSFGTSTTTTSVTFVSSTNVVYSATISSISNSQIICAIPSALATGSVATLFVTQYLEVSNNASVSLLSVPTVLSESPAGGTSSTLVTINGLNLGTTLANVLVYFQQVPSGSLIPSGTISFVSNNGTVVQCYPPSSLSEATYYIIVCNSALCSATPSPQFYYVAGPPTITGISPSGGALSTPITVTGSEFGLTYSVSYLSVSVTNNSYSLACTVSSSPFGSSQFICNMASALSPGFYYVSVTRFQSTVESTAVFHYVSTYITSVYPVGGVLGSNIVVSGIFNTVAPDQTSFGITVGGLPCNVNTGLITSTSATCTLPAAGLSSETAYPVKISFFAIPSSETVTQNFTVINAITATSPISPAGGFITVSQPVTITGSNFGPATTSPPLLSNFNVTVDGATPNSCIVTSIISPASLVCTLPAISSGASLYNVQVTRYLTAATTPLPTYRYINAMFFLNVYPAGGSSSGGGSLNLTSTSNWGSSICPSVNEFTVNVGGFLCPVTTIGPGCAYIICSPIPSGSVGIVTVTLTRFGNAAASNNGNYTYVQPPTITSVTPSYGPANGIVQITVSGSNFPASLSSISSTVGSYPCSSPTLIGGDLSLQTNNRFACNTPALSAGNGSQPVAFTVFGGVSSSGNPSYTYIGGPLVVSIFPTGGNISGGEILTLSGSGFGADSNSSITIGGHLCPIVVGSLNGGGTSVQCTVPAATTSGSYSVIAYRYTFASTETTHLQFIYVQIPTLISVSPNVSQSGATVGVSVTFPSTTNAGIIPTSAYYIFIGGNPCFSTSSVILGGTNNVTVNCTVPPGQYGTPQAVTMYVFEGRTAPGCVLALGSVVFNYNNNVLISNISPIGGQAGDVLTITGGGFTGNVSVLIGSVGSQQLCPIVNIYGALKILCIVPSSSTIPLLVPIIVLLNNAIPSNTTSPISFMYLSPPVLTSITPNGGVVGAIVTITGSGLSYQTVTATIYIGGILCTNVISSNSTTVIVSVPLINSGNQPVTAQSFSVSSASPGSVYFDYVGVVFLNSISPAGGTVSQSIIVTGGGFGSNPNAPSLSATVGGYPCTITSSAPLSGTSFACTISSSLSFGLATVNVYSYGVQAFTGSNLVQYDYVNNPVITSLSPIGGMAGTLVTISGSGFGSNSAVIQVLFNSIVVGIVPGSLLSSSTIVVVCPSGVAEEQFNVSLSVYGVVSNSNLVFTYAVLPTVTSISPSVGVLNTGGTTVVITGTGFGHVSSAVTANIGSTSNPATQCTSLTLQSSSQLTCIAPVSSSGGSYVVSVTRFSVLTSTSDSVLYMYISAPAVSGVSPVAGVGNTIVQITGNGFGSNPLLLSVTVGGVICAIDTSSLASNGQSVSCTIAPTSSLPPAPSALSIIVSVNGVASTTSSTTYQLILPPVISSITPNAISSGQIVTITGNNFGNIPLNVAVQFSANGGGRVIGSVTSVTNRTVLVMVPTMVAGFYNVTVTNYNVVSNIGNFELLGETQILNVFPAGGVIGTNIVITGLVFVVGATNVSICNVPATITYQSTDRTTLNVTAPNTTLPSPVTCTVSVTVAGVPAVNTGSFLYPFLPVISSISPAGGQLGQYITIGGSNFGTSASDLQASVGGYPATIIPNSVLSTGTSITILVPNGLPSYGTYLVTITRFTSVSSLPTPNSYYQYIPTPNITNLSPIGGSTLYNTLLTVTGYNFGSLQSAISIQIGNPTDPPQPCPIVTGSLVSLANSSFYDSSVVCTVPNGLLGYRQVILYRFSVASAVTAITYFDYINAPAVSSINPVGGAAGTTVTVSGANFGSDITQLAIIFIVKNSTVTGTGNNNSLSYDCALVPGSLTTSGTQVFCIVPAVTDIAGFSGLATIAATSIGIPSSNSTGQLVTFDYIVQPTVLSVTPTGGISGESITIEAIISEGAVMNDISILIGGEVCTLYAMTHNSTSFGVGNYVYTISCILGAGVTGQTTLFLYYFDVAGIPALTFEYAIIPTLSSVASSPPDSQISTTYWQTLIGSQANSGDEGMVILLSGQNLGRDITSSLAFFYSAIGDFSILCPALAGSTIVTDLTTGNQIYSCVVPDLSSLSTSEATCPNGGGSEAGVYQTSIYISRFQDSLTSNYIDFYYVASQWNLTSIYPRAAAVSDTSALIVTIDGIGFGLCDATTGVLLGSGDNIVSLPVVPQSLTDTSILATFPGGDFCSGVECSQSVRVLRRGVYGNSLIAFNYIRKPWLHSISPQGGSSGTVITIVSEMLGDDESALSISLTLTQSSNPPTSCVIVSGSLTAASTINTSLLLLHYNVSEVTAIGLQEIQCIVPTLEAGLMVVSVSRLDVSNDASSVVYFQYVNAPVIYSISPQGGIAGSVVTVTGTNFGTSTTVIDIVIGGLVPCLVQNFSLNAAGTQVQCVISTSSVIPPSFIWNSYLLSMTVFDVMNSYRGSAFAAASFQFIQAPALTSITPAGGSSGSLITLSGTNFGNQTSMTAYVGGQSCTIVSESVSNTQIICQISSNMQIGVFNVTVSDYQVSSALTQIQTGVVTFEFIEGATLQSVKPKGGISQTLMTVSGEGFGEVLSELHVELFAPSCVNLDAKILPVNCTFVCPVATSIFSQNHFKLLNYNSVICKVPTLPEFHSTTKFDVYVNRYAVASTIVYGGFTYVPRNRLEYVSMLEAVAVIFLFLSLLGIVLACFLSYSLFKYRESKLVQVLQPKFCQLIIFGAIIGFVGVIIQAGEPTSVICMAQIWLPGLSFSFVFSNVFVKTWRIWRIFDNKAIRKVKIEDKDLLMSSFGLVAVEVLGLVLVSLIFPFEPKIDISSSASTYVCYSSKQSIFDIAQFGWKLINLVFGVFLVWSTRNVVSKFNESKDIAFAMYNYFAATLMEVVFVALVPPGSQTVYALVSLCQLVVLYGTLLILFAKKVYLLWKFNGEIVEEMGFKETIMGSASLGGQGQGDAATFGGDTHSNSDNHSIHEGAMFWGTAPGSGGANLNSDNNLNSKLDLLSNANSSYNVGKFT